MQLEPAAPSENVTPLPPPAERSPELEAVWTYRGYRLDHGDFNAAMIHLYRAEITRANAWRARLDVSTNWAIISTGATITIGFGESNVHHSVMLLNLVLVTLFLFIEARRYRYFELWSYRIRLMEMNFFGALLVPPFQPAADWAQNLAESLQRPRFTVSYWEAFGRRLRRNYVWIYLVVQITWLAKLLLMPGDPLTLRRLVIRSSLGLVPGGAVLGMVLVFDLILVFIAIYTLRLHEASGEVLPPDESVTPPSPGTT